MANTKTTKREFYAQLLGLGAVKEQKDLVKFINHEIELLDRKSNKSKDGKPNKTQEENQILKGHIVSVLTVDKNMRVADIQAQKTELKDFSNQKMSALLKQLVTEGKVEKIIEKRVSYFKLATPVAEEEVQA